MVEMARILASQAGECGEGFRFGPTVLLPESGDGLVNSQSIVLQQSKRLTGAALAEGGCFGKVLRR